jgi:hypothetical protein
MRVGGSVIYRSHVVSASGEIPWQTESHGGTANSLGIGEPITRLPAI